MSSTSRTVLRSIKDADIDRGWLMDDSEMKPSSEIPLALEVGKVAGAMTVLASEVTGLRSDVASVHEQLANGAVRMTAIEAQVSRMADLQKIANGRTSKIEIAGERVAKRVGLLEQWRATITFLPRLLDKLAEHKVVGLVIAAIVSGLVGAALQKFL
ncbi:MAG: hypothetical protein JHC87_09350 [Thermoleophilaceae bacterium]|nr:hypothetical protein [Thermoleophilaceae bacterium]